MNRLDAIRNADRTARDRIFNMSDSQKELNMQRILRDLELNDDVSEQPDAIAIIDIPGQIQAAIIEEQYATA